MTFRPTPLLLLATTPPLHNNYYVSALAVLLTLLLLPTLLHLPTLLLLPIAYRIHLYSIGYAITHPVTLATLYAVL